MKRMLVVLLGALFLAGCGGGAEDVSSGSPGRDAEGGVSAGSANVGEKESVDGGSYVRLSPDELKTALADEQFTLVNVHIPFAGNISGTDLSIPYNQIGSRENLARLPDKGSRVVLYCLGGPMSYEAARTLVGLGYENVQVLDGGMYAWRDAGYRLEGV